jgi:hypothetical protein
MVKVSWNKVEECSTAVSKTGRGGKPVFLDTSGLFDHSASIAIRNTETLHLLFEVVKAAYEFQ